MIGRRESPAAATHGTATHPAGHGPRAGASGGGRAGKPMHSSIRWITES